MNKKRPPDWWLEFVDKRISPKISKQSKDWNERCETPAGKACLGETPQAKAEEAHRPPAESKCLPFQSMFMLYKP